MSMFNMDAPLLTPDLQRAFKEDPELQQELKKNFTRFCEFLGFQHIQNDDGSCEVEIADHFDSRRGDCWTDMFGRNHNWLRISRVLQCLGLCSMPKEQRAFMDCLERVYEQRLARCDSAVP